MATYIEWVLNPDYTLGITCNPITGCLKGCKFCYARRLAMGRLRHVYLKNYDSAILAPPELTGRLPSFSNPDPFYPRFWPDVLNRLQRKSNWVYGNERVVKRQLKRRGIFVCDMSDLVGIGVPDTWTRQVMDVIRELKDDRFYILTKQYHRLIEYSPFSSNAWVGASVTNQEQLCDALDGLWDVQAPVKYLSIEPLHEYLNGGECQGRRLEGLKSAGISWVIIGCETISGHPIKEKLPEIGAIREIIRTCDDFGIKVFLKNSLREYLAENTTPWAWAGTEVLRQEMPKEVVNAGVN